MKSRDLCRRILIAGIVVGSAALLPATAVAATGQVTLEVPNASGTQFGFDVDSASLAPATAASTDVRTHTSTTLGYRQLVALNGAGVAKLATADFDSVSCTTMRGTTYGTTVFTGTDGTTDPVPGTIFVLRTFLGSYGKLQLVSIKTVAPKGLVFDYVTSDCPLDSTPPVITPSVTGSEGNAGWYVGPVTVSWSVADPESAVTSTDGCDETALSDDTLSTTLACSAVSAGGASSESVTVAIDQTPPVVAYHGNRGTYDIDEQVKIECATSDETSGIASEDCESIDVPAYELGPGEHSASASASDVAGNEGHGTTSFEVIVTPGGLTRLIVRLVADPELAETLRAKADKVTDAPSASARAGAVGSFKNFVKAKTGKGLSEATANLLVGLVCRL